MIGGSFEPIKIALWHTEKPFAVNGPIGWNGEHWGSRGYEWCDDLLSGRTRSSDVDPPWRLRAYLALGCVTLADIVHLNKSTLRCAYDGW